MTNSNHRTRKATIILGNDDIDKGIVQNVDIYRISYQQECCIDKNIESARKTVFSLLGQSLSYKCKLSQSVQYHIWCIFIKPVLRSGLSALPIRPSNMKHLTNFHRKMLRGILKLSYTSPIVPLYFLLGEFPMEVTLHLDILSLFWNVWSNPHTQTFEVVKY